MTEDEYITVGNLENISNALGCLSNVMQGEEYLVDRKRFCAAYNELCEIQTELFSKISIEQEED